jgi:hypothetical protein
MKCWWEHKEGPIYLLRRSFDHCLKSYDDTLTFEFDVSSFKVTLKINGNNTSWYVRRVNADIWEQECIVSSKNKWTSVSDSSEYEQVYQDFIQRRTLQEITG